MSDEIVAPRRKHWRTLYTNVGGMSNNSAGVEEFQTQHTSNHKEHRDHKEKADQAQVGSFFAFFVISVVKNQATFGMPHTTGAI